MTETGKVKPDADPVQVALSRIMKLGGGGTLGLLIALGSAVLWLKSTMEETVRSTTREVVREVVRDEMRGIEERLRRVEFEQEIQRRTSAKEK